MQSRDSSDDAIHEGKPKLASGPLEPATESTDDAIRIGAAAGIIIGIIVVAIMRKTGQDPIMSNAGKGPSYGYLGVVMESFHNGSVPTLHDVLSSKTRSRIFTRSYNTDEAACDKVQVGWKVEVLKEAPKNLSPQERRRIYDTTQPGRGNGGHTFGDTLADKQRRALIEYLKTL